MLMNTTIRSVSTADRAHAAAFGQWAPDPGYEVAAFRVGDERITCALLHRGDPTAAAEHRIGLAAKPPITALALLQESRGFMRALGSVYDVDLGDGFDRVTYIQGIRGSLALVADSHYRNAVVAELCRRTLTTRGFLVVRPARGMWQSTDQVVQSAGPQWNEELALCHLFGSSGFAQLCDPDILDKPVPLFLQPWSRDDGLLLPQRLPEESFSQALCVHRLGAGRLVLFEKAHGYSP
jgi:hypothetical protein